MKTSLFQRRFGSLLVAACVLALDQASKALLLAVAKANVFPLTVLPFFRLVVVQNRGISFGMLAHTPAWAPLMLTLLSSCIVLLLLFWLWRARDPGTAMALALIIGGAAGNIADRARVGAVTDFLDFHLGPYHWPAFNIADSAILIGVVILVLISIVGPGSTQKPDMDL